MRTILVASSKGGAGKTTLTTNLAAHFAVGGHATAILDADRQKSSTRWCEKRAAMPSAVLPLDGTRRGWERTLPDGIEYLVVDAPAGAYAGSHADRQGELGRLRHCRWSRRPHRIMELRRLL